MQLTETPKLYKREFINEDGEIERICASCNESWPADTEFYHRCPDMPRGLHIYCKACMLERRKDCYQRTKIKTRREISMDCPIGLDKIHRQNCYFVRNGKCECERIMKDEHTQVKA